MNRRFFGTAGMLRSVVVGTTDRCGARCDRDAARALEGAMGRPAQPGELSPACVFLASPACSSYVSGAVLPVMGGPRG